MQSTLIKNLPIILKDKSIMSLFVVFVSLIMLLIFSVGLAINEYSKAEEVKIQIETMNNYLKEWNEKRQKLGREKYRPVKPEQVEQIQSQIILNLKGNNLVMDGLRSVREETEGKNKNFRHMTYELSVTGNYENTMKLLTNFNVENALITIKSLNISPETEDKFKTKMVYKIYING